MFDGADSMFLKVIECIVGAWVIGGLAGVMGWFTHKWTRSNTIAWYAGIVVTVLALVVVVIYRHSRGHSFS